MQTLGLDLGTNSIGWALIENETEEEVKRIVALGSRIIPMDKTTLDNFSKGISESQTKERTGFRGARRLKERYLLRRERLHRVLHALNFLPSHYDQQIDFKNRLGQFHHNVEPKLAYVKNQDGTFEFLFKDSFSEMLDDFRVHQPQLLEDNRKVPYDWTLYYLRKKGLTTKITKEEFAWVLLSFNQKRG